MKINKKKCLWFFAAGAGEGGGGTVECDLGNKIKIKKYLLACKKTPPRVSNQIKTKKKTGPVYLSLDVDGIDPSAMPGVAYPEPGEMKGLKLPKIFAAKKKFNRKRMSIEKISCGCVTVLQLCPFLFFFSKFPLIERE